MLNGYIYAIAIVRLHRLKDRSRIKASCQAKSIILSWDDALNASANRTKAAETFAKQLGWSVKWVGGGLPDGRSAYCCVDGFTDEAFTPPGAR